MEAYTIYIYIYIYIPTTIFQKQKQENGYLPLASKQETNTVLEHTVDRVDQLPHQLNHSFQQCPANEQFGEPSIQIYSEQTAKNEHTVHVVEQYEQSLGNEHAIERNEQFVEMVDVDSVGKGSRKNEGLRHKGGGRGQNVATKQKRPKYLNH